MPEMLSCFHAKTCATWQRPQASYPKAAVAERRTAMFAAGRKMAPLLLVFLLMMLCAPSAHASGVAVNVAQNATFGTILTDSAGKVLYRFTRDTINVSSACYNQCATVWPPLLIDEGTPVAGEGVNGDLLGVLTRTDGTRQVMYNGMPLYYYNQDANPGDTHGQRVRDVWFIVHPNTTTVGYQPATVRVRQHAELGNFLTDDQGKTLYLFTRDSANHTVCYDRCATNWPPLLVDASAPTLAEGVGGALGTLLRDDGNRQVTYESKPLYYYTPDTTTGDTKGQGVGNVWFVVAPVSVSAPAAPAGPAPAEGPAALPRTGGDSSSTGWLVALSLLLLGLGGALVSLRQRGRSV
jgi:predicted lipoprotein with Yx(FWY)xxD motif